MGGCATRDRRKAESGKEPLHVINERIVAPTVLLISDQGEQLGVKPTAEARQIAQDAGMDLVLVAPNADPPVARVMDYGKFKYEMSKKQHSPHKHQSQLKELRLRPKTDQHDQEVRLSQARRFLERGDRVVVNMLFRGREVTHTELGIQILGRFAAALEDVAKVEKAPSLENQRMTMILVQK